MKKYLIFSLIILSNLFALNVYAETTTNAGFIPGQIWYSKEPLVEGDIVNIHTAVWNGEKDSLSAKVEFYDKNVILGSRDVVLAASELKDISVSWKITSGDHTISAKIISSTSTISGKKENVVLSRPVTESDTQSVAAVIKNANGETVSSTDVIKNQIEKAGTEINNILPESVSSSISSSLSNVDSFRTNTTSLVDTAKKDVQKEIDSMNNTVVKSNSKTVAQKSTIEDSVQKPVAYIKLFLFSILSFIFSNKIIFYGILLVILFYVIRFIYRKIKNR